MKKNREVERQTNTPGNFGIRRLIPMGVHLPLSAGGDSKLFLTHASEDLREQILEEKILKKMT